MKKIGILAIALMTLLPSCNKYEEGPGISLTSRTERVANTWIVGRATSDGEDITDDFEQFELYFTSDGDAELTAEYEFLGATFTTDTQGTWEFTNDQENLSVDFDDDSFDNTYQILKLTKDELWLREIGEDLELELVEK